MDRGAWWASPWGYKGLDMTERAHTGREGGALQISSGRALWAEK